MDLRALWVALPFVICQVVSEQHDFLTVLRYEENGYSTHGTTELHQANGSGLPLRTRNGFFIDSVEGMPSLNCSPAIEDCDWQKTGNWMYTDVDISEDENLSLNIDEVSDDVHGLYQTCDHYKGGCEMGCIQHDMRSDCICPADTILQNNGTCKYSSAVTIIRSSGTFYKSSGHMGQHTLYFVPPMNAILSVDTRIEESGRSNIHVTATGIDRNGEKNAMYFNAYQSDNTFQTKNILKLTVDYRERYRYPSFVSGEVKIKRRHLTLTNTHGSLKYNMHPVADALCVSVIYKSKSETASINLSVTLQNGTIIKASEIAERENSQWSQKRFHVFLGDLDSQVVLSLEVTGNGTVIYSINGCSPHGNQVVNVLKNTASPPNIQEFQLVAYSEQCSRQGRFNQTTKECDCCVGFTGRKCEEVCGFNSYGNDCSLTCSDFNWGCAGMLFCKPHWPCYCAPGYKGLKCNIGCSEGTYGPNCLHQCGNCKDLPCDSITGVCHSGCKAGYYPPHCVTPYKYAKDAPTIVHKDMNVTTIRLDSSQTNGEGDIKYYQIQYYNTEGAVNNWIETLPRKLNQSIIYQNITGLQSGRQYAMRVVFIDRDGNSYQGNLVQTIMFYASCSRSISTEYQISHVSSPSGFYLQWQYDINATDCPITSYVVIIRRNGHHIKFKTVNPYIVFENFLSGNEYQVKVGAQTAFTNHAFSSWYSVITNDQAPQYVSNLRVSASRGHTLNVSWASPKYTAGSLQKYVIRYKSIKFLACSEPLKQEEVEETEVIVGSNVTSLLLGGLNSHALYIVNVAGTTGNLTGPFTSVQCLTDETAPVTQPLMSDHSILSSSNTTVTVQWMESTNCSLLNGYFVGYRYELLALNKTLILEGETHITNATFKDLIPRTTYLVNVYIISSGGWNDAKKITIQVSTKATVPEKVENLTVYKRGRRLIGLRWGPPVNTFGEIKSYLISYCEADGDCERELTQRTLPIACSAWPHLFCFSIGNLEVNKKYSISVRARNKEIDDDGSPETVLAQTSEGVPHGVLGLRMVNQTYQSITIEWKPPFIFNGILRSFLINVEHMDSANSSLCCTYFPVQEVPVTSEPESFVFEVLDLIPASKYIIGVACKTKSIGPSSTVSVSTSPEVPKFNPPQMVANASVLLPVQEEYIGVNSTYLLIILPYNGSTSSVIFDEEIHKAIEDAVTRNFYVVDEYDPSEFPTVVSLGSDEEPHNGTFGILQNRPLPEKFHVGLLLIQEYYEAKNIGFVAIDSQIGLTTEKKTEQLKLNKV